MNSVKKQSKFIIKTYKSGVKMGLTDAETAKSALVLFSTLAMKHDLNREYASEVADAILDQAYGEEFQSLITGDMH